MSQSSQFNRRRFLRTTSLAAGSGALGFPSICRAASPNGKVTHAAIGVGGMGWADLNGILSHGKAEVIALCDVDSEKLKKAAQKVPGARLYKDWRELLEKEGDKVDSVSVSVPDHMHAVIAAAAMEAGKHVYCQKPMCHDVAEVRYLTELAKRKGVVTQLGNQHSSGTGDRMGVEWVRSGVIGKVKHLYLCSNRKSAMSIRRIGPRPETGQEPPSHLDWDLWTGTAPMRPYAPGLYHPVCWRSWQDFGTGWSGDIGCHILSAPWKALDLTAPKDVVARVPQQWLESPKFRNDLWPVANHITWTFPGTDRTVGDEITVEWFDGVDSDFYPPAEIMKLYPGKEYPQEAAMFVGEEGYLLLPHTSGPMLLPREKLGTEKRPDIRGESHYHGYLNGIIDGKPVESHFGLAGPMTETVLLGTVAVRTPGEKLTWDPAGMKIPNNATANGLLRREYREGWKQQGLG